MTSTETNRDASQVDAASLDQIREIIIGGESRRIEAKLSRIEELVTRSSEAAQKSIGEMQRVVQESREFLQAKIDRELEELRCQVRALQDQCNRQKSDFEQRHASVTSELQQCAATLSTRLDMMQQECNERMQQRLADATSQWAEKLGDLRNHVERDIAHVSCQAVTRHDFGDALHELARRFSTEAT